MIIRTTCLKNTSVYCTDFYDIPPFNLFGYPQKTLKYYHSNHNYYTTYTSLYIFPVNMLLEFSI
jgi:hypothetical protein